MIPMLLSYIDENITMSSESVLMKKSQCKWKQDCRKYCRLCGSGIDEKWQWLAYGHPYAKSQSLAYGQHVSKSCGRKVQWEGLMLNDAYVTHLISSLVPK